MGGQGGRSKHRPEYDRLREAIRGAREARRMSQRELSRRLNMMPTYITKVESGERRVDVVELADIARVLEADLSTLIAGVLSASEAGGKTSDETSG